MWDKENSHKEGGASQRDASFLFSQTTLGPTSLVPTYEFQKLDFVQATY